MSRQRLCRLADGSGRVALAAALALAAAQAAAQSLPQGGSVVAGAGSITVSDETLRVRQATALLGIDWQSFNIGTGERVVFEQPSAAAVAVNRVIGNDPSAILGQLEANGQVFLINPNGIVFSRTARVDVGGLVASTARTWSGEAGGALRLEGAGGGGISNAGTLNAAGSLVMVAGRILNAGSLAGGQVDLAAASDVQLALDAGGKVRLHLDRGALGAAIANDGTITADNGGIYLTAQGLDAALGSITSTGALRSQGEEPSVSLLAEGGRVTLSGPITATGASGQGGTVRITAQSVALDDTAAIDASGLAGGGSIAVGGEAHGGGTLPHANEVTIAAGARLSADALGDGQGGSVVVWSDGTTRVAGAISARGAGRGDGGFVETSGARLTIAETARVDALSPEGRAGDWLLDPRTITVGATGSATLAAAANQTDQSSDITIAASTINGAAANVVLAASDKVTINSAIAMTNNSVGLTITGAGGAAPVSGIDINANVTTRAGTQTYNGDVTLAADLRSTNAAISVNGNLAVTGTRTIGIGSGLLSVTGNLTGAAGALLNRTGSGGVQLGQAGQTSQLGLNVSAASGFVRALGNVVLSQSSTISIASGSAAISATNGFFEVAGSLNAATGSETLTVVGIGANRIGASANGGVGQGQALAALTLGSGETRINGGVTTTGNQTYGGKVQVVEGDLVSTAGSITTSNFLAFDRLTSPARATALQGSITVGEGLATTGVSLELAARDSLDIHAIGISATNGTVGSVLTFPGMITGTTRLAAGTITLGGVDMSGTLLVEGNVTLANNQGANLGWNTRASTSLTSAGQTLSGMSLWVNGTLTLPAGVTLTTGATQPGGTRITSLEGPGTLRSYGTQLTEIGSAGQTTALGSVSFANPVRAGSVRTSGDQSYQGGINLFGQMEAGGSILVNGMVIDGNSTITTTGGGNVVLTGQIASGAAALPHLAVTSSGVLDVSGASFGLGGQEIGDLSLSAGAGGLAVGSGNAVAGTLQLSAPGGDVTFLNASALRLGSVWAGGNLDIATSSGDLTVAGQVHADGDATLAAGRDADPRSAAEIAAGGGDLSGNLVLDQALWDVDLASHQLRLFTGSLTASSGLVGAGRPVPAGASRYYVGAGLDTAGMGPGAFAFYREQPLATVTPVAPGSGRFYDGVTTTVGASVTGLVNGDSVGGLGHTFDITGGGPVLRDAAEYGITVSGGSAVDALAALGYAIELPSVAYSIVPRPLVLTYTATASHWVYGAASQPLTGSVTGNNFVSGDGLLTGAVWSTLAQQGSGVGRYAVTGSGASVGPNYTVTQAAQAAGNATALTIDPRPLRVTAGSPSITYGAPVPVLPYVTAGLLDGDVLTGALAIVAPSRPSAGSYVIGPGTLDAGPNYSLIFTPGTMTVNPALVGYAGGLRVIPKTADGSPFAVIDRAGLLLSGLVPGESVSLVLGSASFADALAGLGKPVTVSLVGISGPDSPNYRFTPVDVILPGSILAPAPNLKPPLRPEASSLRPGRVGPGMCGALAALPAPTGGGLSSGTWQCRPATGDQAAASIGN